MFFFSAKAEATDSTDTEKHMAEDELEACLACPDEAKKTDILMWWKTKSTWPELLLMARQYLATIYAALQLGWNVCLARQTSRHKMVI